MKRRLAVGLSALLLASAATNLALAQQTPEFKLGFKALADELPEVVGQPIENEWHNPANGDGLQRTSTGLMVWRKADNWTAFTDGTRTWVNGPFGIQSRLNSERLAWEPDIPIPTLMTALPAQRAPTPTAAPTPAAIVQGARSPLPRAETGPARSVGSISAVYAGEASGVIVTATGYMRQQMIGERVPAAEGHLFVVLTVALQNSRASSLPYSPFDLKLRDARDREFPARGVSYALPGYLGSGMIAVGKEVSGHLVFEVPSSSSGHQLIYDPVGVSGFDPLVIDLR